MAYKKQVNKDVTEEINKPSEFFSIMSYALISMILDDTLGLARGEYLNK